VPNLSAAVTGSSAAAVAPSSPKTPDYRSLGLISLRPANITAAVGQEFRVDMLTQRMDDVPDSSMTVSYDPQVLDFLRILPGAASISSRAADGQVIVSLKRRNEGSTGEGVLAMLFFKPKTKGDVSLTVQTPPAGGTLAPPDTMITEEALVHVQ
jgi:hypothetical protein